jgi:parvulin-like peptidyl-prolyl isomerase
MTIQQSGITLAKLKNKYKEQIMMRKLVAGTISQGVNISPTEIAAYYYGNIKDFQTPKMVRFKVLLIKPSADRNIQLTEVLALQVLDRIRAGEDFDILVKEYSQGPNIDTGGDMGYMPEDGIIKELKDAMSQLQAGEVSGLVKTVSGFNIVKVIDRKEPGAKPLAEVTDVIRERLFQRESELTLREFINKLKEDAYIKIQ